MIRTFTLVIGQILSSGSLVTGTVPIEDATFEVGRVQACQVYSGNIAFCRGPYTGDAVLPRGVDGKYVVCRVISGHVSRCSSTGYSGTVALQERR